MYYCLFIAFEVGNAHHNIHFRKKTKFNLKIMCAIFFTIAEYENNCGTLFFTEF